MATVALVLLLLLMRFLPPDDLALAFLVLGYGILLCQHIVELIVKFFGS
jgi:hypothetical protein